MPFTKGNIKQVCLLHITHLQCLHGFVLVVTIIMTPIRGNHPIKAPLDQQNISYVTGNTWNNLPKTINNKHVHEFSSFFKVIKSYSFRTYQNNCT